MNNDKLRLNEYLYRTFLALKMDSGDAGMLADKLTPEGIRLITEKRLCIDEVLPEILKVKFGIL